MKLKIIFIFLIFPIILFSQKIKTENVIKVSDSILKLEVGENLFKYFSISEGSYYKYRVNKKSESTGKFLSKKRLNKHTTEIWVLYHFECSELQNARSGLWIKLNEKLNLIETLKIKFIPEFLKNNLPSNFLTNENAEKIIEKTLTQKGFEISKPKLKFDEKKSKYIYYSINKLTKTKNTNGKDSGETEIITIDALNGDLISIEKGYYVIIIR
jgi:hypothetical protein